MGRSAQIDALVPSTPLLDNPLCTHCGEPLPCYPVVRAGRTTLRRRPKYCSDGCQRAERRLQNPGAWEANRRAVVRLVIECRRRRKTAAAVLASDIASASSAPPTGVSSMPADGPLPPSRSGSGR